MKAFENFHSRKNESSAKWHLMEEKSKLPLDSVVPMSVADMEFDIAQEIKDGLKAYIDSTIPGYAMPSDAYYEAVSDHYRKKFDLEVKKEEIIPTMGVVPGLFSAVRAISKEGQGIIVFTPVYPNFYNAINFTGRKEVKCPLIYKDKKYYIDFELFESLAKEEDNKALILCSPHNPSGRIWDDKDLKKLVDICKKHDLFLISDEIHADLGLFGNKIKTIYKFTDDFDNIMVFSSASKTYNIAGLQTANAIIKDEKIRGLFNKELENLGFHWPNMMGLKATELAYRHGDTWLNGALSVIEENFRLTKDFFESYGDLFEVYDSQATYLAWVNFEKFAHKFEISAKDFCLFLDDANFFINPGIMFGRQAKYFIRINVALPKHKYLENLERLKDKIKERFNI